MDNELRSEFGCIEPIRLLDPSNTSMLDADGNVVMCKCGEKADNVIIGKEAYLAQCNECMFGLKD